MPDAMTTLLANVGLSDLERRLRDEAVDETTFLDLDDEDLIGSFDGAAGHAWRRR